MPLRDSDETPAVGVGYLDPLSRLAIRYGTDKFGEHLYTPTYHRLLAHLREQPVRLLEIGVGGYENPREGGASLRMWAEYFPYGRIVGLDYYAKSLALPGRVAVVQGSQADPAIIDTIWAEHGPFDIVIDDGSHRTDHVLTSFRLIYPRMRPGALYVVEDTQTAFWPSFGGSLDASGTIYDLVHQIGLAMHQTEIRAVGGEPVATDYGDMTASIRLLRNLIVVERGTNDYPSNYAFDAGHPAVERVQDDVAAEAARAPSPGAFVTRLGMAMRANRIEIAVAIALEAVAAYPEHSDVLFAAARALHRANKAPEYAAVVGALKTLFPQDPYVTGLTRTVYDAQPYYRATTITMNPPSWS